MKFSTYLILSLLAFATKSYAEVLKWNCEFEIRIDADGAENELMPLAFTVDTESHLAFMEGNVGVVEVEIFIGDEAFSFIQRITSGSLQTTTILRSGFAVHSRNTVISGELVAAQHFGRCSLI